MSRIGQLTSRIRCFHRGAISPNNGMFFVQVERTGFTVTPYKKEARRCIGSDIYVKNFDNISDIKPRSRNTKLEDVIRSGMKHLDSSAVAIQANRHTRKSISIGQNEELAPEPRQLAEEERIYSIATSCLEQICATDSSFPLMTADEPVLLLSCKVNASHSYADVYWSLPYSILSTNELTVSQRTFLHEEMESRIQGGPGKALLKQMHKHLRSYFPPKIRFTAATPAMVNAWLDVVDGR